MEKVSNSVADACAKRLPNSLNEIGAETFPSSHLAFFTESCKSEGGEASGPSPSLAVLDGGVMFIIEPPSITQSTLQMPDWYRSK